MKIKSVFDGRIGPKIFQINISDGGVPKLAVQTADVGEMGLQGDRQQSLNVHGGPDRAVTLFSLERILGLQTEGHPIFPGALGENLTLAGLDWDEIQPGVKMQLGEQVVLEITKFASPCNQLAPYLIDGDYGRVSQNHFPGWSRVCARVITPGMLSVGDRIVLS